MMNSLQRAAVLTQLINKLRDSGSWCGETHIQKATYFLQALAEVPLDFDFGLYKHGPFSFELRDMLTELRADGLIGLEPRPYPYGPSYTTTKSSRRFRARFSHTLKKYGDDICFVTKTVGGKGVVELEQLSTALIVSREMEPNASSDSCARRICALKPHVNYEDALQAVKAIDKILATSAS